MTASLLSQYLLIYRQPEILRQFFLQQFCLGFDAGGHLRLEFDQFAGEVELISGAGIINDILFGFRAAAGTAPLRYVRENDNSNIVDTSVQPSTFKRPFRTPRLPYKNGDTMRAFMIATTFNATGSAVIGLSRLSLREYDRQIG